MKLGGSRVRTTEMAKEILHSTEYHIQCKKQVELPVSGRSQLRDGLAWSVDGEHCASFVLIGFHFCLSIFLYNYYY